MVDVKYVIEGKTLDRVTEWSKMSYNQKIKELLHIELAGKSVQSNLVGKVTETWKLPDSGIIHRNFGPAETIYENGILVSECYYKGGFKHREDGPAYIKYSKGKVQSHTYMRWSQWHREDGPAFISYTESGEIKDQAYYLCDILNNEKSWKSEIKRINLGFKEKDLTYLQSKGFTYQENATYPEGGYYCHDVLSPNSSNPGRILVRFKKGDVAPYHLCFYENDKNAFGIVASSSLSGLKDELEIRLETRSMDPGSLLYPRQIRDLMKQLKQSKKRK